MSEVDKLVRKNVRELIPYSSARDEYEGDMGIFLDANENPYGTMNRYPDPHHKKLRNAISRFKNVPQENIFLGNGSDEVIDLCFRIFCNPGTDKALIMTPTYGMYEVAAAVNDVEVVRVPLDETFNISIPSVIPLLHDERLKLVFICSPNNPTGNSMESNDIELIINSFKGIVLIDEAYIDFSLHPSLSQKIMRYPNLIVMQTFSKALGMAAARIGIAFASSEIIKYFYRVKSPYNISALNQEKAFLKLAERGTIANQVRTILQERERLIDRLNKIVSVEKVFPSDANFVLVRVKDADLIYSRLLERGVIVRNRNRIIRNCLRITVGAPEENSKLLNELEKIDL
ncbi:MAG: histidinol-phosphate transaminase [Bacteroidales bacterium]|jgi:histidinol-phosphate aminotransferase|nr:histidinol-phosphate transaminase [Bacteroidales bacterium]MCU0410820.1 histidinol-phosphate transaminase [Bacteroidales bacterium]